MERFSHRGLEWALGSSGAVLLAAAATAPEAAMYNLSGWAKNLHLEWLSDALSDPSADGWGLFVGALLMLIALTVWNARGRATRMTKTQPPPSIQHTVTSHGQTGGVTAHTVQMSEVSRDLSSPEAQSVRDELTALDRGGEWCVESILGNAECRSLALQVVAFLRAQNVPLRNGTPAQASYVGEGPKGLIISGHERTIYVGPPG